MIYCIINYNLIYSDIYNNIINYCNNFNLDFDNLKLKDKRNILIYYSSLKLIEELKKEKHKKPILIFENLEKNKLIEFTLKKVSKILLMPIHIDDKIEKSDGMIKELELKADDFYFKNTFNFKKIKKNLSVFTNDKLEKEIKSIKFLATSH